MFRLFRKSLAGISLALIAVAAHATGLTESTWNWNQTFALGSTTVTLTVPANSAVGVMVMMHGNGGATYGAGSVADTGSNTYTSAGGVAFTSNGGINYTYSDGFYCLSTGSSATTVTYTTPSAYSGGSLDSVWVAVWVWTVTGGSATFGSQSSNGQNAPGTGTDAVTSLSVTASTGSVIMGVVRDGAGNSLTLGTGFTSDVANLFGNFSAEHGAFSSAHAATFTAGTGTDNPILTQAISFGFSTGGGAVQSKSMLLGIGAALIDAPKLYHDIDPIDCRRWLAANESIYQAAA